MKIKFTLSLLTVVFLLSFTSGSTAGPLLGNYTINSAQPTGGSNFQSFNDLADSINANGILGNVVITVAPGSGPYNEQVEFINIAGTSALATVTLDGSGETITALTDSTNRHVVRISDCEYFTVTDLRVNYNPLSTSGFYGIHIYNSGDHITITNCVVDISGTTSTLIGAYIASGSTTSILSTGDFHNISITNDTAIGGGYGASLFGLITNLATGINISNNVFYDFHSNGVYLRETNGAIVSNNFFDKRTSQVTSVNAIQLAQSSNDNGNIFNNRITVSQTDNNTMQFRGIYLFNGTGHKVYNNLIYDIHLIEGNFTAIEVRSASTSPQICFNTISIDNPATSASDLTGISEELSNTNSVIRNNIISITQPTTRVKTALMLGATSTVTTAITSDHNVFNVPGGNVAVKGSTTPVLYPTLSDWQTASTQDMNSVNADPAFTSLTNPVPTASAVDGTGIPISFVTTDITGATRGTPPDAGAFEFIPVGIAKTETPGLLQIYPNPATDYIIINLTSNAKNVIVTSVTGAIVLSHELPNNPDKLILHTSGLSKGIYSVTVLTDVSSSARLIIE
jgi:hypothetical protein